ncbi:uncharacterized protein J4E78_007153 [Alternaria triticimaculans]|uniref:uncharacterized protein n=1 Tax=Alternaria triticimaculans TaxID=297637 RepID=UPI0020C480BB|nr:uncharacterized protein J4E78_007153 [Alternaria triticimaculans]KAI4654974.1 hypothetical protein J4E78_007153 [Alternaria triticimaculans]
MNEERRHTSRQPRDPSRPSITKEDIGQAERMVADAVQMVDAAMSRHATKALEKEKKALSDVCESAEFKSRVAAFRRDILAKEAFLPPDSELAKNIARERIYKRVHDFEIKLQHDMLDEQARRPAKTSNKPHGHKPKTPRSHPKVSSSRNLQSEKSAGFYHVIDGMAPVEVSSTGFVHFPRHPDDENDWERISRRSTPEPEEKEKAGGDVNGSKGLFQGWFGK